ncbi:MAG: tetratricopeptide repeat protein [Bacteroidales bacterium]|nr:tetratricopeptide repeat protein [Bacteroidales bacterium]
MKEIKVFLASSEELKYDRLAFSDLIRKLDNIYEKRGIRIKLFQWEDFDAAYNDKRKQDEYNEYIKQSDLFLALFRTKAGKFTVEEFELARNEHREKGLPKPHVYCRDLEQGETEDATLTEFKQRLFAEMGHFFARYKNEDGLNLHFVMQLQLLENSRSEQVETDGNLITFCGEPIAKTDNIDFFAKNKDFIRMREDLKDLNEDIRDLRLRLENSPEDEKLKNRIQEKLNKRNALQEEFEHYRKQILNIERRIIELQGQEINEAVKRAMEAFAEGEVNKADIILSEATQGVAQRREEYIEHKKTGEQMRKNLLADIDALLLKAETVLSNTEKTIEERKSEALNAYREADKTAQEIDCPAEKYIHLLNIYGLHLTYYAYYEEAENVYLRSIQISEETNGKNDMTAMSYNNLGQVYYKSENYDDALKYFNKAFEIYKVVLEKNNPLIATCYNNIGLIYSYLEKYDKALDYHNKALEIKKEVYGEMHRSTAASYDNIGIVFEGLEEYDTALKFSSYALEIFKEVLDENDPQIAGCYNNIGIDYQDLRDYDKALENHNKALEIRKAALGENHPDTAKSYDSIGTVYLYLRNYDEALKHYNKALEIFKVVLGENHPDTTNSYHNIGCVYSNLGADSFDSEDYNNALKYHNKALEIFKDVLGENNTDTATSYFNIGVVYTKLGDYNKALGFSHKAWEIFEEVLGESHPYTQMALQNIERIKQMLKESQCKREETIIIQETPQEKVKEPEVIQEESQGNTEEPEVAQEIQQNKTEEPKKKKGFFSKLFGK